MDLLITTITWLLNGGAVLTVIGLVVFGVIAYKTYKDAKVRIDQFDEAMRFKHEEFDKERERIKNKMKKWG